jgi:PAS domain S-box-containing protein
MKENILSTGIFSLDSVFSKIDPGDNLVWQVDDFRDYEIFVKPFVKYCLSHDFKIVYVSFNGALIHVLKKIAGSRKIEIAEFSEIEDMGEYEKRLTGHIIGNGEGVMYIFDSLTVLKEIWHSDKKLSEFFEKICPVLYDMKDLAYFAIERGKHDIETIGRIKDTAQIFMDIARTNGRILIQPIRVLNRYSPDMFKPHVFDKGRVRVVEKVDFEDYARRLEEKSSELHKIMSEMKKVTKEIRQLKEFNESIVKNMQEGLLIVDIDGYIRFLNPKIEEMLGCPKEELIGKPLIEMISMDYQKKLREEMVKTSKIEKKRFESAVVTNDGREIPVIISSTPLFVNDDYTGVLLVLTDITEMKEAEDELREKMLKYDMTKGNIYLMKERRLKLTIDVFSDLIHCGYKGLIITRRHPEKIRKKFEDIPVIWLSEHAYDEDTLQPQFDLIEGKIKEYLTRNTVVLLDRLDYLITKNGFIETLNFIQRLYELFYISKNILILSIDHKTLSPKELSLLEEESREIKLKGERGLQYGLMEILEFIYQENRRGKKPSHTELIKKFRITRATAKKRLIQLENRGLILDIKNGKRKILEITEKGKIFFRT